MEAHSLSSQPLNEMQPGQRLIHAKVRLKSNHFD